MQPSPALLSSTTATSFAGIDPSDGRAGLTQAFGGANTAYRAVASTDDNGEKAAAAGGRAGRSLISLPQPSHQAPPPHPLTALPTPMAVLAQGRISWPSTPPTAPDRPQTTMAEIGQRLPFPPSLVKINTTTSSNRSHPAWIRLSAMGVAATTIIGWG